MGQNSKSRIHTYLTVGGIFYLYEWISITISVWANLKENPARLEIIVLFKAKVGANSRYLESPDPLVVGSFEK